MGGATNSLNIFDLKDLTWEKIETMGNKPSYREGHTSIFHDKELYIIGGCNYKLNICYNDTYVLNVNTLYWSKFNDLKYICFNNKKTYIFTYFD